MNEIKKTSNMIPESMNDKMMMADVLSKANGNLLPSHFKKKEDIFLALQMGAEIGLSPMQALNNIYVVNGKPTLPTNLKLGLARNTTTYLGSKVSYNDQRTECTVTVKRKLASGEIEESEGFFSVEMAKKAGLMNKDNWEKYPDRMIKHRAMVRALDDAYSEMFAGIYDPEELEGIQIQDGIGNVVDNININLANEGSVFDEVKIND